METVQKRGAAVIAARGASSAFSAARAIVEHVRSWHLGTPDGELVSMGVISTGGLYGAPEGLIFSYPVTIKNGAPSSSLSQSLSASLVSHFCLGKWNVVRNITLNEGLQKALKVTADELVDERKMALGI